ncbi:MAG TPA: hypothetical protein VLU46_09340 [Thermoanaerobaculia bacterium]|nr:hypothetical protein [Thermoanaerobaculia bacterium]
MKRLIAVALLLLLVVSCGGSRSGVTMDDLQNKNEELKARVKSLEDQLLDVQKKQIQDDQALRAIAERLRNAETSIDKLALGPAH